MHQPRFLIPLTNGAIVRAQHLLAMNVESEWGLSELGETITIEHDNAAKFAELSAQGFNVSPRVEGGEFNTALIVIGKHSELNKAMIGRAWAQVAEGGDILVEGAKTDGIDSLLRGLRALGLNPNVEPKSHGKIIWFKREQAIIGAINAWHDADLPYTNDAGFTVRAGIFSAKAIDKGTAYFLEHLKVPLTGKVADFGGGYGVLSREMLAKNEGIEAMDIYEVSSLATGCAQSNINDDRAHFHWLDVAQAAKAHYDVIISNPPFHNGRKGDPAIGLAFIDAAARSLRARGTFYMVANRHLPYEHRLKGRFGYVEVVHESNAYKIFKAARPSSKGL